MQEFRIPIAGPYNTRATGAIIGTSSGIVGVGIVGIMIVGSPGGGSSKDRRFINCWYETVIDPVNNTKTIYLVKRPGFASHTTPQSGSIGNTLMVWSGQGSGTKVISAFGATNSSIYDGVSQLVTNNGDTTIITGKATGITETQISNTATLAISSSDSTGWWYQNAGTVTKIVSAGWPGSGGLGNTIVGTFAHMDGFAFIMDSTGNIYNSDLNSISTWKASSVIPTNSYPDGGVGLIRLGNRIMAFNYGSIQFFTNSGNSFGSVLRRQDASTIKVGCINADSIARLSDTVYWVGSSAEGGVSVYSYGAEFKRVSSPELDRVLLTTGNANISLTSGKFFGRSFVIVRAATLTFVYCQEEDSWHQWESATALWDICTGVSAGSEQPIYSISKTSTTGKVFIINPVAYVYQDNGSAYTATAQTGQMGSGNKRVFWHEVEFLSDIEPATSTLSVYASDDDYASTELIGAVDLSQPRPRLYRCGSAYRRSWILQHSSNTGFRIEAMIGRRNEGVL